GSNPGGESLEGAAGVESSHRIRDLDSYPRQATGRLARGPGASSARSRFVYRDGAPGAGSRARALSSLGAPPRRATSRFHGVRAVERADAPARQLRPATHRRRADHALRNLPPVETMKAHETALGLVWSS